MRNLCLALLIPLIFSCANSSASPWKPYVFNGTGFSPPAEKPFTAIWVRFGHPPTSADSAPGAEVSDKLPPGTGAVAGICYAQTSGGKLSVAKSFTPYPNEQITFTNKTEGTSVTRTNKEGYFTEYLNAGDYELYCRGVRTEFRVKQGETTLVPIRGGKRMVD